MSFGGTLTSYAEFAATGLEAISQAGAAAVEAGAAGSQAGAAHLRESWQIPGVSMADFKAGDVL